jgi:pilus assembly protein Flp/PilA
MNKLVRRLRRRQDEGATAVEYGLLIALIAVVLAAGAFALGSALNTKLDSVADCVAGSGVGGADADCS